MATLASSRTMSKCGQRPRDAKPSIGHSGLFGGPRPRARRRGGLSLLRALRGFLLFDLLVVVSARGADRDPARLHRVRNLAYQLALQQAVLDVPTLRLHMIGQAEGPLEGAGGDALVQHRLGVLHGFPALDGQRVLLGGDAQILRLEPGNSQADGILVLAAPLDVVRWIVVVRVPAGRVLDEVEETIKAARRAPQRGEVPRAHLHILVMSNMVTGTGHLSGTPPTGPLGRPVPRLSAAKKEVDESAFRSRGRGEIFSMNFRRGEIGRAEGR